MTTKTSKRPRTIDGKPTPGPLRAGKIIQHGRGPAIAGTRITVYDVLDYVQLGWHRDRIAVLFQLASREIQAALDYIEQHRELVEAEYEKILERNRHARNPPEVQAILDASHKNFCEKLKQARQRKRNAAHAENHG